MPTSDEWEKFRVWLLAVISIILLAGLRFVVLYSDDILSERHEERKVTIEEKRRALAPTPVPFIIPVQEKKG